MKRLLLLSLLIFPVLSCDARAQFQIDISQFDSWIFGSMRNEIGARTNLNKRVDLEIDRLELGFPLTEEQKEKIRLAGLGDIKHFFDDVRTARQTFNEMGSIDQAKMNEAYQLAQPLSQRLNKGLFGTESLLSKVAYGSLNEEQAAALKERRRFLRERKIESVIVTTVAGWSRTLALTEEQRDSLSKMIRESIEIKQPGAPYATMLLSFQLGKRSDEELQEILDDEQTKAFRKVARQAEAMRPFLIQQGLLEDE